MTLCVTVPYRISYLKFSLTLSLTEVNRYTRMLEGITNKIAFPVVLLSACCWVVYITGFGLRYEQSTFKGSNTSVLSPNYFSNWCFSVSGLPLYFLTFVHLLCGNVATAVLVLAFVPLFLVSLGGVVNSDGQYLYKYYSHESVSMDYKGYVAVEFGGALGALVFYWLSLVMWTCYSYSKRQRRTGGYERLS